MKIYSLRAGPGWN